MTQPHSSLWLGWCFGMAIVLVFDLFGRATVCFSPSPPSAVSFSSSSVWNGSRISNQSNLSSIPIRNVSIFWQPCDWLCLIERWSSSAGINRCFIFHTFHCFEWNLVCLGLAYLQAFLMDSKGFHLIRVPSSGKFISSFPQEDKHPIDGLLHPSQRTRLGFRSERKYSEYGMDFHQGLSTSVAICRRNRMTIHIYTYTFIYILKSAWRSKRKKFRHATAKCYYYWDQQTPI